MTWMFMNHRNKTDSAYIQYRVTYDTAPHKPAKPYWLDVKNCLSDPVYDIAGGRRPGSTTRRSDHLDRARDRPRSSPAAATCTAGRRAWTSTRRNCTLYRSRPTWGSKRHPFYNVKPVLHEPGPIEHDRVHQREGLPRAAGREAAAATPTTTASCLHTRVMGIMVVFLAKDGGVKRTSELRQAARPARLPRAARAHEAAALHGAAHRPGHERQGAQDRRAAGRARAACASGSVIDVGDRFFKHAERVRARRARCSTGASAATSCTT